MSKAVSEIGKIPFGKILKKIMVDRDLTLAQVADLAGVKTSTVNDWVNGSSPHDLNSINRLSKSLGIPFKSLLLGEPEESQKVKDVTQLFDEVDLFEGMCKVSIKKLVLKDEK